MGEGIIKLFKRLRHKAKPFTTPFAVIYSVSFWAFDQPSVGKLSFSPFSFTKQFLIKPQQYRLRDTN